jgi:hypothetical protein
MPAARRARTVKRTATPEDIEDILSVHTPEVRAVVENLRALIKETAPDAEERAYHGGHALGYRTKEAGHFCNIFPSEDAVELAFERGALLPDPDGLLEGDGKQVRYVTVRDVKGTRRAEIKRLLRAATLQSP